MRAMAVRGQVMSLKPLPLRTTMRMIFMKWLGGKVDTMTWAQLGQHKKPVLIANINGFWDPLIALLRHMADAGFIRNGFEVSYLVANTAEEIVPKLLAATPAAPAPRAAEPIPIADL